METQQAAQAPMKELEPLLSVEGASLVPGYGLLQGQQSVCWVHILDPLHQRELTMITFVALRTSSHCEVGM
jgi:hypothetical protein